MKTDFSAFRMRYISSANSGMHENSLTNLSAKMEESNSKLNESPSIDSQPQDKNEKKRTSCEKNNVLEMPKGTRLKYEATSHYKPVYNTKSFKQPLPKKKLAPISNPLLNTSAKVVLFERNVEIKDLESKVKYLQNKLKDLESENRTLQNVQSRQARELKKFKEGVAEIPSLLKSHKEETKVYESTISTVRRELRDCQKELKLRNESLLKKESHIVKLNINLKQSEKMVNSLSSEIKELKIHKKDLEEENKMLVSANETLKCENESLCKNVKDLMCKIQILEEATKRKDNLNEKITKDLDDLNAKMSTELSTSNPEEKVSCYDAKDNSGSAASKLPFDPNFNNENAKAEEPVMDEIDDEILPDKRSIDKTKDALIYAFKHYQNVCKSRLNNSDTNLIGAGGSNQKLLPPLKTITKSFPPIISSDDNDSEFFSFHKDMQLKDTTKYQHCENVIEECYCKLASHINTLRNRNSLSVDSLKKKKTDLEKCLKYGCKNQKSEIILNNDQSKIKNDASEVDSFEVTRASSKKSAKTENHNLLESFSDDVAYQKNKSQIDVSYKLDSDVNKVNRFLNQNTVSENSLKKNYGSSCNVSKITRKHRKKETKNSFSSKLLSSGHEIGNNLMSEKHRHFKESLLKANKLCKNSKSANDLQNRSTFSLDCNATCRPQNIVSKNVMKEQHNCSSEFPQNVTHCYDNNVFTKDKNLAIDGDEVNRFENKNSDFVKVKPVFEDSAKDKIECCQNDEIFSGSQRKLVVGDSEASWLENSTFAAQKLKASMNKWPSKSNDSDSHFELSWWEDW